MAFLERGILRAKGGRIELGADVVMTRGAANRLDTPDALQVSGTANLVAATRVGGLLTLAAGITQSGGAVSLGGTTTVTNKLVIPYGTVTEGGTATLPATNGEIRLFHKFHVPYLEVQSGGTIYICKLPTVSAGTALWQIGGTIGDS